VVCIFVELGGIKGQIETEMAGLDCAVIAAVNYSVVPSFSRHGYFEMSFLCTNELNMALLFILILQCNIIASM